MKNKKLLNMEIKEVAEDSRVLSFIGSDASEDRSQEIMTIDGWELDNYIKNPVILFGHDYSKPPVGKANRVSVGEMGLEFDVEFADKETYPFADTVFRLLKGGFLKAVSVGFITKENNYDPKSGKNYITKKELLELSIVPVPCNPNALALAFEKGIINEDEVRSVTKSFEAGEKIGRTISAKNEKLLVNAKEAMKSAIEALEAVMDIQDDTETEDEKGIKNLYDTLLHVKGAVCGCQKQSHDSLSGNIEDTIKSIQEVSK